MDFASSTTLHGIRYLAEPSMFLMRRFNDFTVAIPISGYITSGY